MADDDCDNLDSWEDQADSGELDKRLEEISIDLQSKEKSKQKQNSVLVSAEESGRSQYQPQVRILRRAAHPSSGQSPNHSNSTGSQVNHGPSASRHAKSVQQRQDEYAEARMRIFGSLPLPETEGDCEGDGSGDNHKVPTRPPHIVGAPTLGAQVSILRQPRGPDGTSGFGQQDLT